MIDATNRPNAPGDDDLELLMRRYQQGDATAATSLTESLSGKLYRFFLVQARDPHRAEDLLQDCWLQIHKSRHTYRPGEPVLPWIFAIARHVQVDHYRKRQRIAQHEVWHENVEQISAVTASSASRPHLPEISDLLKSLPRQQQETVLLLKVAGLSLEEVSRATGASIGAVKQRAHRAYTTLRRLFGEER